MSLLAPTPLVPGAVRLLLTGIPGAPAAAPSVAASGVLSGRRLTVTVDSVTGNPPPALSIAMTSDGAPVAPDGAGPWTYDAPDAAASQTIAWVVTAANGFAPDATATGSAAVAANLSAPAWTTLPAVSLSGRTVTVTRGTASGTPAPTYAITATVDGSPVSMSGSGPWTYAAASSASAKAFAATVTASNGAAPSVTQDVTQTIAADLSAPTAAGALADLTLTKGAAMTAVNVAADFSGTAPITYALAPSSAALPAGLTLSSAGSLSGTPTTVAGAVSIVVRGTNAHGVADSAFSVTFNDVAGAAPQLAPNLPLGTLLSAAPDDIGGASWTALLTPSLTAGTVVGGVQPYEMVTATDGGRMRSASFTNTAVGDALVAVFVGEPVSGDMIETGIQTVSDNNRVRARVMANVTTGTPTYDLGVIGGGQVAMIDNHALGLERLADGFVRMTLIVSRKAITANARTYPFWGAGGVAKTVEGWRCSLFKLLRPTASAVVVSDTEIALSLDAAWSGWGLGATVEYRVDGGAAVAVPEPGVTTITVAGPGTYTIERREAWPQASVPGVSPLMAAGGSQFATLWLEVA